MISMKTARCRSCGGIVFKLAGKASRYCFDVCAECRGVEEAPKEASPQDAKATGAAS